MTQLLHLVQQIGKAPCRLPIIYNFVCASLLPFAIGVYVLYNNSKFVLQLFIPGSLQDGPKVGSLLDSRIFKMPQSV